MRPVDRPSMRDLSLGVLSALRWQVTVIPALELAFHRHLALEAHEGAGPDGGGRWSCASSRALLPGTT